MWRFSNSTFIVCKIYEDLPFQEMKLIPQDIVPASMEISRDYASMIHKYDKHSQSATLVIVHFVTKID